MYLLLIALLVLALPGFAQDSSRQWLPYKVELKDHISSIKRAPGEVTVTIKNVRVDSTWEKGRRLEKKTILEETRTFTKGKVTTRLQGTFSINAIRFREEVRAVPIPGSNPPTAESIRWITRDSTTSGDSVVHYPAIVADTFLSKTRLITLYDRYYYRTRRRQLQIGVEYAPMLSYRVVLVNDPTFAGKDVVDQRELNERATYGFSLSLPIGISIRGRKSWMLTPIYLQQGFATHRSKIDWKTGLPGAEAAKTIYKFFFWGAGISYQHNGGARRVNAIKNVGLSILSLFRFKDGTRDIRGGDLASDPTTANFNRIYVVGRAGVGVNYRLTNGMSLQVVPSIQYSFTALNKETLKTNLISFAIPVRINFLKY